MASQTNPDLVKDLPVPTPAKPVDNPAAVDPARDFRDEKVKEQAAERSDAAKKQPRFMARKLPAPGPRPEANPEYETLLFASAANNQLMDLNDYSASTFIPFFATAYYLLMYMDHTMASTRKFTDNCLGWAPPLTQVYIGVLLYVQILRAKDAAGDLRSNQHEANFLKAFIDTFPLSELWIPGPLVALFRNVSAFWPSQDDFFGNVSPTIPSHPGWSKANFGRLSDYRRRAGISVHLPHSAFSNHINGPNYISRLFGTALNNGANEQWILCSPGLKFAYPDNLQLWQNAAAAMNRLSIPRDFDFSATPAAGAPTNPVNTWQAFVRFDQIANEYRWFGPVSAIMALYSKFFHGSTNLESIQPNSSAAPAVKMTLTATATLVNVPVWQPTRGSGGDDATDGTNSTAHYVLENSADVFFDTKNALKGVPVANIYAAVTYNINCARNSTDGTSFREGPFWKLGPDVQGRDNMNVIQGVFSSIIRDYHSPVALPTGK